jgi:hypothetical protein
MGTMGKLNHKLGCNVMGNLYHDVCADAKIEVNCGDLTSGPHWNHGNCKVNYPNIAELFSFVNYCI